MKVVKVLAAIVALSCLLFYVVVASMGIDELMKSSGIPLVVGVVARVVWYAAAEM